MGDESSKSTNLEDNAFLSMISVSGPSQSDTVIYPALLSQIATALKQKLTIGSRTKVSVEYKDSFYGSEAVDALCFLLQTGDRSLALLYGRALESQKLFHEVAFTNRLRDSANEVYQFTSQKKGKEDKIQPPCGVFTLLTDCYSSTCNRLNVCYSVTCPRRFEQLGRRSSETSAGDSSSDIATKEPIIMKPKDWTETVTKEIVDALPSSERTRQNAIFELIETESEFVQDLHNTYKLFVEPLLNQDIIEESRRQKFVSDVFSNILEIKKINLNLLTRLQARQTESPMVDKVGDIFVNIATEFYPYVQYGAKQVFAKSLVDEERESNPEFVKFLKTREKLPELRKLALETFLGRPTTRLGRYLLLLKPVMEKAPEGHPDKTLIPQAIATIREVLSNINVEVGKADNKLKLLQLDKRILAPDEDKAELNLMDEKRLLLREGKLMMRRATADVEVYIFLFDHMLLLCRKKDNTYKMLRKPIPLDLLVLKDDRAAHQANSPIAKNATFQLDPLKQQAPVKSLSTVSTSTVSSFALSFQHLGRQGGTFVLYANSEANKDSWYSAIQNQKEKLTLSKMRFEITTLVDNTFPWINRVNCSAIYQKRILVGTEFGLFVGQDNTGTDNLGSIVFSKVLDIEKVMQVDVLPSYDLLLILADRTFLSFPLAVLEVTEETNSGMRRKGKKIANSVSFFKQGICADRSFVCAVKSTTLTATIKVLEPVGLGVSNLRGKIGKLFRSPNEPLRVYKEFYIPTESRSIHFLKTKLCVGCAKGFEIVDLDSLNTQALLDPTDVNLDFVSRKETIKPIAIFRVKDGDFLLCYNEFGFYVDKYGRRSRSNWMVMWSGAPTSFSLIYPYIVAFEPSFIEVRHAETGHLQQVIPTKHLRTLNTDGQIMDCVMESSSPEFQHIFRLKLIEGE